MTRHLLFLDIDPSEASIAAYRDWHRAGGPPAAVNRSIRASGIESLEIWHVGDRLAMALAPLGIVRGTALAGDGTDIGPVIRTGVAGVDLNQSGLRYFDWHHTPEDTLDRIDPAQLQQNVAAWTTMLSIVANAPEEIGPVTPRG